MHPIRSTIARLTALLWSQAPVLHHPVLPSIWGAPNPVNHPYGTKRTSCRGAHMRAVRAAKKRRNKARR